MSLLRLEGLTEGRMSGLESYLHGAMRTSALQKTSNIAFAELETLVRS
jgi:hypothetical protein